NWRYLQPFYNSTITSKAPDRRIALDALQGGLYMASLPINLTNVPAYHDEHLTLEFAQQAVILDSQRMTLTRKEYDLLALLVQHAGEIIPRDALLMRVWGYGAEIRTRTLDVHVRRLRKKLGGYADQYIETIFGIGYRFQPFHAPRFFQPAPVVKPIALGA